MDDYLNMWVSIGKEEYIYISTILDNENMGVSVFLGMAGVTGSTGTSHKTYKTGELTFTKSQKERVSKRVKELNDIRDFSTSYESFRNSSSFIKAIVNVIGNAQYKHDRMMQSLESSPGSIAKSNATSDYVQVLSSLYNKGLKNRVRFAG